MAQQPTDNTSKNTAQHSRTQARTQQKHSKHSRNSKTQQEHSKTRKNTANTARNTAKHSENTAKHSTAKNTAEHSKTHSHSKTQQEPQQEHTKTQQEHSKNKAKNTAKTQQEHSKTQQETQQTQQETQQETQQHQNTARTQQKQHTAKHSKNTAKHSKTHNATGTTFPPTCAGGVVCCGVAPLELQCRYSVLQRAIFNAVLCRGHHATPRWSNNYADNITLQQEQQQHNQYAAITFYQQHNIAHPGTTFYRQFTYEQDIIYPSTKDTICNTTNTNTTKYGAGHYMQDANITKYGALASRNIGHSHHKMSNILQRTRP
nr:protein kinase 4-like [Penaeus vannamei]